MTLQKLEEENIRSSRKIELTLRTAIKSVKFDCFMAVVILVNIILIYVQFEWKGFDIAYKLHLRDDDANYFSTEKYFRGLELLFVTVYLIEFVVRICLLGWRYYCDLSN